MHIKHPHSAVVPPASEAAVCPACPSLNIGRSKPHRLKLWQLLGQLECSIVGTCLSQQDLALVLKRCDLRADADIENYELHAYVVSNISDEGVLPRAIHRLLDRRHEGLLRIVGRTSDASELERIWDREFKAGRVAGAYWAFMTHGHIPEELSRRVFGEVHMLSHVLARTTHSTAERASELEARVADLEAQVTRQRARHESALKERDSTIKELRLRADSTVPAIAVPQTQPKQSRPRTNDKRDRALVIARQRARAAEALSLERQRENRRLEEECRRLSMLLDRLQGDNCPGAAACRIQIEDGERARILYLGGRSGSISHLRTIAAQASADFFHHDGGQEQAFGLIENLISQCHMVVCPIDCINHRACLLAKHQCRRQHKAFVPLRSSGGSEFKRALDQLLAG